MSKIRMNVLLTKDNKTLITTKCNGILIDNKIKYEEQNMKNILDIKNNTLTRKNNEYEIYLDFTNQQGSYIYNQLQIPITLDIDKLINESNKYYIHYKLTMSDEKIGDFTYEVNYEVIK